MGRQGRDWGQCSSGFGHDAFLIEAVEDTDHRPTGLDEVDGGLEVKTKVDKIPFDVLAWYSSCLRTNMW